ncbi:hypothetical protein ACWGPW_24205 [Paenibacillus chitinolyticus]
MLEKWQCHHCEKGFLLIEEQAKGISVHCPFCGETGKHLEAVTGQNPDEDLESEMGCLWPGYNSLDKACYLMSSGQITKEEANDHIRAIMRGEKPDMQK